MKRSFLFKHACLSVVVCAAAIAHAQAPTAPGKPLPPGSAQPKVKAACTHCHNAGRITEQRLTRQQWSEELKKMDGLGANVPQADRAAILNYLTKNFGPKPGEKTEVKKAME
jgi:hypothetical protein